MPAALRANASQQSHSQQSEIANDVQNLVTHEFIAESQSRFIQHAVLGQDNRIVERAAADQIRPAQRFNFFDKPKSARRSNIARKRAVIQSDRAMLHADERMRKIDGAIDLVNIRWLDRNAAIAGCS